MHMNNAQLHDFLFDLYDFADTIAAKIQPGEPENNSYFMTLVYIEDIMDKYGRGLVLDAAQTADPPTTDPQALLRTANERLNQLRERIETLAREYNMGETITARAQQLAARWQTGS
jgi:hypothetical protein